MHISARKKFQPLKKLASLKKDKKAAAQDKRTLNFVSKRVLNDPNFTMGMPDKLGNQLIYQDGKEVGWVNPGQGTGWLDDTTLKVSAPLDESVLAAEDIESTEDIQASDTIESKSDLRRELRDLIDEDMCREIVDLAYSQDGAFGDAVFDDSETFFGDVIANYEAEEVARMFFFGEDLDSGGSDKDHANPTRGYFRFDGNANVESTDYPETAYYDMLDDVINYVLDHLDLDRYPEEVQELVNEYNEFAGESEEDEETEDEE